MDTSFWCIIDNHVFIHTGIKTKVTVYSITYMQTDIFLTNRATIASYGVYYKNFFMSSDSKVLRTFGHLIYFGTNIVDGLTDALSMK